MHFDIFAEYTLQFIIAAATISQPKLPPTNYIDGSLWIRADPREMDNETRVEMMDFLDEFDCGKCMSPYYTMLIEERLNCSLPANCGNCSDWTADEFTTNKRLTYHRNCTDTDTANISTIVEGFKNDSDSSQEDCERFF